MSGLCDLLTEEHEVAPHPYNPIILQAELNLGRNWKPEYPIEKACWAQRHFHLMEFTKKIIRYHFVGGEFKIKSIQYL